MMVEPLLENLRLLGVKVGSVLGGTAFDLPGLTGFLNSEFDPFLNQLFAAGSLAPREAAGALVGRPGFVWLAEDPEEGEIAAPGGLHPSVALMHGMTGTTTAWAAAPQIDGEILEVRSASELQGWHEVYCEVFGSDHRGRQDWLRIHDALGPSVDRSLVLLLARVDGSPAATGGVYFESGVAGLYCFTTRERMRGRGLASALVHACHAAAQGRGIERAVLQATAPGKPVYTKAGYREQRMLPVLVFRPTRPSQATIGGGDPTGPTGQ
jgi:GNAT superfamily N-acetyltransferase